jgi:hypothetical protein
MFFTALVIVSCYPLAMYLIGREITAEAEEAATAASPTEPQQQHRQHQQLHRAQTEQQWRCRTNREDCQFGVVGAYIDSDESSDSEGSFGSLIVNPNYEGVAGFVSGECSEVGGERQGEAKEAGGKLYGFNKAASCGGLHGIIDEETGKNLYGTIEAVEKAICNKVTPEQRFAMLDEERRRIRWRLFGSSCD